MLKLLVFFCLVAPLGAAEGLQDVGVTHEVTRLLIQLGVILVAAKLGGRAAKRLHLPGLMGEVSAGLLLGPYALGSVPVPGFPDGLIPLAEGTFPLSLQLWSFAAVGAVIHVLVVGLESDVDLFARIRQRGFAVALGSSLFALAAGVLMGTLGFGFPLFDRRVFFLAALSVSTSLGVQARILHAQHRMGSPEGAAVVSSSLLQDGFAIIFLVMATAIGGVQLGHEQGELWSTVIPVTLIALGILGGGAWLTFWAAPRLAKLFRRFTSPNLYIVLVVALALGLSGVFETFGVAAILGAYLIGLAFSRTDLGDLLAEKAQPISEFFVPVLYVVMGMLVDFRVLVNPAILLPGLAFAALSAGAKLLGSAGPALATGFSGWGALRVGLGTVPRGEVALIIAAVGLGLGDFSLEIFQVMVVMIVFSVALGAPLFALSLRRGGPGTRGAWGQVETASAELNLPNTELTDLITDGLLRVAEEDGFFVHRLELSGTVYRLRRDEVFLTLHKQDCRLEMVCAPQDLGLAKTLLYEVIVHVRDRMARITEVTVPQELRRDAAAGGSRPSLDLGQFLRSDAVVVPLQSRDKGGVIAELVEALDRAGRLRNKAQVLADVMEREQSVSTGLEKGIAIPHGRSIGVDSICLAAGLAPEGVDFQALDGAPSQFVFLIVSAPENRGPHLQLLAALAKQMRQDSRRQACLAAANSRAFVAAVLQP